MVSVWDKLKEMYGSWKMLGTDVVPLLWAEGDRMQKRIEELEIINIELAIRYGSLIKKNIDAEQKLEAIRDLVEAYRVSGDHSLARAHITLFKIDEVLGDE